MKEITLKRISSGNDGTFGQLYVPDPVFGGTALKLFCVTAELPWRNNRKQISCILAGTYKVIKHNSPKFGACWWVQNVSGREEILIHVGNYAGDVTLGYKSDVAGCILLGDGMSTIDADPHPEVDKIQRMVTQSKATCKRFMAYMKDAQEFELTIVDKEGTDGK